MQILTVDVGTGTQDVYLLRTGMSPENGFKLVMPSPTMLTRNDIQKATAEGIDILLTGVTMGGGPSHWAAEEHIEAGYKVYATPPAARSFNDDIDLLQKEMGIIIVSSDEAEALTGVRKLELCDFNCGAMAQAFRAFGVALDPDAIGIAVFDHGEAPPGVSDRRFRFDYLKSRLEEEPQLTAFAFRTSQIPTTLTRMRAVARSADLDCPVVLMDTAPAAVLGAAQDPKVGDRMRTLTVNIGNFHTLAFRTCGDDVEGLFEHHTGLIDQAHLESLLTEFAAGKLSGEQIYAENGHGALTFDSTPLSLDGAGIIVTGPRRGMLKGSRLKPYFAVPHGDMMLSGCFGLLAAIAKHVPDLREPISATLSGEYNNVTPWDSEGA